MARNLKPQVVKTIRHPRSLETCDLMLDRNRIVFYADYGGEHFEHPAASSVEHWISAALEDGIQIAWVPIMHIHAMRDDPRYSHRAELRIKADRFWVGVTHNGLLKQCKWVEDESLRFLQTTLDQYRIRNMQGCRIKFQIADGAPVLPLRETSDHQSFGDHWIEQEVYILFDEATWAGLKHLQDLLRLLGERLERLIGDDTERAAITAVGSRMLALLPAPEEKPEPAEPKDQTVTKHIVHFQIDPGLLTDLGLRIKTDD